MGDLVVVAGSAGRSETTTPGTDPLRVDGARYQAWLRAFDGAGAVRWTHPVVGPREVHPRALAALGRDLVVVGEHRAGDVREYMGWAMRVGPSGMERWQRTVGSPGATALLAIAVLADGVVVAGGVQRGAGWLLAMDPDGRPLREQTVDDLDEVTALLPLGDGVVAAGVTGRTSTAAGTSRLVAFDRAGNLRWSTALPPSAPGELYALAAHGRGGVAVGQGSADGDRRPGAWIVRFDQDGQVLASAVLTGAPIESARAVASLPDGGFAVAGDALEQLRDRRGRLWRFGPSGDLQWQKTYGTTGNELVRGLATTPDGGLVLAGSTQPPGAMLRPWVLAVTPDGTTREAGDYPL